MLSAGINHYQGGDQLDKLLWRLRHGASGALTPKVACLLIGVSSFSRRGDCPGKVPQGIEAVVKAMNR